MQSLEFVKSQDLLSVSWRPRRASGVVQSKSKVLRTGEANDD